MDTINSWQILSKLEYAIFKMSDTNNFQLVGKPPSWLDTLKEVKQINFSLSEVIQLFPVLTAFLPIADQNWQESDLPYVESGMWEEKDNLGVKNYFSCKACKIDEEKIFLIERHGLGFEQKRNELQNSRKLRLEYEQLIELYHKLLLQLHTVLADFDSPIDIIQKSIKELPTEAYDFPDQKQLAQIARQSEKLKDLLSELSELVNKVEG